MRNTVPVVAPRSKRDIEEIAESILFEVQPEALRGNCPIEIEYIYDVYIPKHFRIKTGYTNLDEIGPNVLGYTDASIRESYVEKNLYESDVLSTLRRGRSTIAHECFHCIEHVPIFNYFRSISRKSDDMLFRANKNDIPAYMNPEWQSWMFAGAILMPEKLTKRHFERGMEENQLADIFNVNPAFARVRLIKLGLKTN